VPHFVQQGLHLGLVWSKVGQDANVALVIEVHTEGVLVLACALVEVAARDNVADVQPNTIVGLRREFLDDVVALALEIDAEVDV